MEKKEEFYQVEKIVGRKKLGDQTLYKVKWQDWPSSTNTWEPLDNLQDVIPMIQ